MAQLTWTAEAERWIRDIYDYIALDDPAAAARTIEPIYRKAETFENFQNQVTATGSSQTDTSASCFTGMTVSPP